MMKEKPPSLSLRIILEKLLMLSIPRLLLGGVPTAITIILPFLLLEVWTNSHLFDYVSYTNSRNMDPQIAYFEARDDWSFVALGSSEVKWGIDPKAIEEELQEHGVSGLGFNLGFDGFNLSFYWSIMPGLELPERLPELRAALIGVNLIQNYRELPNRFEAGFPCDGILQKAVLKSSFAKDHKLDHLYHPNLGPEPLVRFFEARSAVIRYRQSLRTLLLGYSDSDNLIGVASNGLEQAPNGFYPHLPAEKNLADVENSKERWLAQRKDNPEAFKPMPTDHWPHLLEENGFFESWSNYFLSRGILPVFFALPTNPFMIDNTQRRADYQNNSSLMQAWAERQGLVFIDLGIMDDYDPMVDYSDRRHLSEIGARRFSQDLGKALATNNDIITALKQN